VERVLGGEPWGEALRGSFPRAQGKRRRCDGLPKEEGREFGSERGRLKLFKRKLNFKGEEEKNLKKEARPRVKCLLIFYKKRDQEGSGGLRGANLRKEEG